MTHIKRNSTLRQWFGPFAQQLFQKAAHKHSINSIDDHQFSILIDKQAAQYLLIEASFYHQKCMQQYQIANDVKTKNLEPSQIICELLLYIRMTTQHPCHESLQIFADCQLSCILEFETALQSLLDTNLIQKIAFLHFKFYDKNPYPHDHIFDQKQLTLKDHDSITQLFDHQKLINHQTTN